MLSNQPATPVKNQLADVGNTLDMQQQCLKTKCLRVTCTENDSVLAFDDKPQSADCGQ